MLPAVLMMGFFVSILIEIGWGTDPASFMNLNISKVLHWSIGNTAVLVYGIMFVFTFIFGPEVIGFGSLANMILIGYVVDICQWVWEKTGFHALVINASFFQTVVIFIIALLAFVIVASIYMNAQLGLSPYDAIPKILSGWWSKFPFSVLRIIYDLTAVALGVLFGLLSSEGIQGSPLGAVIMAILLGPFITIVGKPLEKILR